MSIENLLSQLIEAVNRNTEALNKPFAAVPVPNIEPTAPISQIPAYETTPLPVTPASVMPAPPSFAPPVMPAAQPVQAALPFNDIAGLVKYATDKFYEFAKVGIDTAVIGTIIQEMGHSNIEHIPPDQFKIFFDKVEAIKKG